MADLILTTDFSQLNSMNNALNETANTVERRTNPAIQKLQQNLEFVKRVNQQVAQSNQTLSKSFTLSELQRTSERLQNYEAVLANTRQGMNNFGVVTQQAGYQIGDFLVQVQSGTNWMVAFGQQATQLVGILPLMGAGFMGLSTGALVALSAGLGIAIPLITALGAAFMRTSSENEDAANSLDSVNEKLKALDATLQEFALTKKAAAAGVSIDELLSIEGLDQAEKSLTSALETLKSFNENISSYGAAGLGGGAFALAMQGASTDELIAAQEVYAKAVERVNNLRNKGYIEAAEFAAEESKNLQDQLLIQELIIKYGEDSALVFSEELRLKKESYAEDLRKKGLGEVIVQNLVAQYDALEESRRRASQTADQAERIAKAIGSIKNTAINVSVNFQARFSNFTGAASEWVNKTLGDMRAMTEPGYIASSPRPQSAPAMLGEPDLPSGGGGGGGGAKQEDALQKLREQLVLENELLGVSEAQERVIKALGDQRSKYSEVEINAITAEIEAYNQKLEALKQQQQLADTLKSSMEDAFMSIIDGTESAKDAFKKMAYEVIKELYKVLIVQRMVGSFNQQTGTGSGLVGLIAGAFGKRESGGSVMAGQPYLVGERGPELVIPRHSGTVVNANQTASAGSNGGAITVQNNITVTGSDAAMVRAEVAKMIPQITNATKAAVIDARLRGGQMAAAFR